MVSYNKRGARNSGRLFRYSDLSGEDGLAGLRQRVLLCLRFGQIRHILYVEGINERTQQDLYVNGVETSVALLKQGFPQEEKQEQKKQERELLYNFPAEDPSEEED